MKPYRVQWWKSPSGAGTSYWHILRSGDILCVSQAYKSAWSCRRTAKKIAKGLGVELEDVSI